MAEVSVGAGPQPPAPGFRRIRPYRRRVMLLAPPSVWPLEQRRDRDRIRPAAVLGGPLAVVGRGGWCGRGRVPSRRAVGPARRALRTRERSGEALPDGPCPGSPSRGVSGAAAATRAAAAAAASSGEAGRLQPLRLRHLLASVPSIGSRPAACAGAGGDRGRERRSALQQQPVPARRVGLGAKSEHRERLPQPGRPTRSWCARRLRRCRRPRWSRPRQQHRYPAALGVARRGGQQPLVRGCWGEPPGHRRRDQRVAGRGRRCRHLLHAARLAPHHPRRHGHRSALASASRRSEDRPGLRRCRVRRSST
jgi:hypothetical protein